MSKVTSKQAPPATSPADARRGFADVLRRIHERDGLWRACGSKACRRRRCCTDDVHERMRRFPKITERLMQEVARVRAEPGAAAYFERLPVGRDVKWSGVAGAVKDTGAAPPRAR